MALRKQKIAVRRLAVTVVCCCITYMVPFFLPRALNWQVIHWWEVSPELMMYWGGMLYSAALHRIYYVLTEKP